MAKKEALRITELIYRLCEYGFTDKEVEAMRRISHTLTRWCEAECSGEIERNEESGLTYSRYGRDLQFICSCRDRENGAIKRMSRILANHPGWSWYYQTDPRGCSVYLYHAGDARLNEYPIKSIYSSIGIAIY